MKKILILLVVLTGLILAGCAGSIDTASERKTRIKNINAMNARMLVDDWDFFWMQDCSSQLMEWHTKFGH
ncbi:MAG: hypothetical protein KAU28_01315 [Phycisphaerae bacterium]|nr:hypothetical protein [Phycisphaerae bacterium]